MPYGHYKAKVDIGYLTSLADRPLGKLVLVTALSPTPPGEGKTTTTVGLTDALHGLGHRTVACLREPSMGPVFGMKGGAAGGGWSQVVPMTDINLHFTGDFAAIAAANNLLAALIDNHVHHGNELDIDVRSVTWKRVLDTNDRALREVVVAHGRPRQRLPPRGRLRHRGGLRADGDLLPDRVVGRPQAAASATSSSATTARRSPVTARDLGAARRDGGAAPRRAGAQPGADARGRAGLRARRPVRQHRPRLQLGDGDPRRAAAGRHRRHRGRLRRRPGRGEVRRHQVPQVRPAARRGRRGRDRARPEVPRRRGPRRPRHRGRRRGRGRHGQPAPPPRQHPRRLRHPVPSSRSTASPPTPTARWPGSSSWSPTRACAPSRPRTSSTAATARRTSPKGVLASLAEPSPYEFSFTYDDDLSLTEKVEAIATRLYGAGLVTWDAKARRRLQRIERDGYGGLPVCVAKTQYSFSTDPDVARRAVGPRAARARGTPLRRRRVRRRGLRRHDDHARPARRPRRPPASTSPTTGRSSASAERPSGRPTSRRAARRTTRSGTRRPEHAYARRRRSTRGRPTRRPVTGDGPGGLATRTARWSRKDGVPSRDRVS